MSTRKLVELLGYVTYYGFFLSPIPTLKKIIKNRDVEEFKSGIYIATMFNCLIWLFLGKAFVHPDRLWTIKSEVLDISFDGISFIGFVFEVVYFIIFYICANDNERELLKIKLFLFGILWVALVNSFVGYTDPTKNSLGVGIACHIMNIVMYVSPLTIMENVIKTKSVKYMPFCPSLALFLNGLCWTAYALIQPFDIYLLISSVIGAISGLVQLILYAYFWCKGENNNDDVNQLSNDDVNQLSNDDVTHVPNPTVPNSVV